MKLTSSKYRLFKANAIYSPEFLNLSGDERSVLVTMINAANDDGVLEHLDQFLWETNIPVHQLEILADRNMITLLTWNSYIINDFDKYVYVEDNPDREMWDEELPPMECMVAEPMQMSCCC